MRVRAVLKRTEGVEHAPEVVEEPHVAAVGASGLTRREAACFGQRERTRRTRAAAARPLIFRREHECVQVMAQQHAGTVEARGLQVHWRHGGGVRAQDA